MHGSGQGMTHRPDLIGSSIFSIKAEALTITLYCRSILSTHKLLVFATMDGQDRTGQDRIGQPDAAGSQQEAIAMGTGNTQVR
jgi:hypothetical protein